MRKKVLKLTLHRKAFEVMVTGEKDEEYRDVSHWIQSRLYDKSNLDRMITRNYDLIEFTNGYGKSRPRFVAQYLGFERRNNVYKIYSNGLKISTGAVYSIKIGKIEIVENWPE